MTRMKRTRTPALTSIAALLAATLTGAAMAQDPADTIYLRDGASESGTIVDESYAGVALQPEKGAKKTIAWDQVQTIQYSDAPLELSAALATLDGGNFEAAVEPLQAILASEQESELRPMILQQTLFHLAFAEQRLGHAEQAMRAYDRLLLGFPNGRYLRMTGENLMALHLAKGDPSTAQVALDALAQNAQKSPGFELELGILRGRLLEAQGKNDEAREQFSAVATAPNAPSGVVQEAKLGRGRLLLREGQKAEAETIFRALVSEPGPARVQSGAWNGLAALRADEGFKAKDSDTLREALYAYLRTVVQYKPLTGESSEEFERALAGAVSCFEYLSQIEQNRERKKLWESRAQERRDQLESEFPHSAFLEKKR